ncbi:unnamed protein product [Auanema sp. JU1783]|nr:unnamed protein product [Auanema sp. JU1783]
MKHLTLLGIVAAVLAVSYAAVLPSPTKVGIEHVGKQKLVRYMRAEAAKPENAFLSCFACTITVDGLQDMLKQNKTDNEIAAFLTSICDLLNVEQPHVCYHIMKAFQDEVVFVLERTVFTPDEICGAFVKDCGQSVNPFHVMWNITIPGNKPPVKPWPKIPDGKPTYKFLQLSDIHIDRQYAEGSEAYCEVDDIEGTYAMCCRNYADDAPAHSSRKDKPVFIPAGKWGMPFLCDIPYRTFESSMKHISQAHKDLDYIIITGDFEAHDSWDYTVDLTKSNIQNVTNVLLKYFPKTPVYVSIGNHEAVPQDAMAPHTMAEYNQRGPQWLYSIMKDMWAHWIPTSALPDVQYRASYSVRPKPGLKLISLNTIYCSEFNFYLYIDQTDPDSTLEWLIEQLQDSESKGEKVHIISHIPPGDDYCLKGWSWNFFEIIRRYEGTVAQMYYGHTHYDHFQVLYESANPNTRPFHMNWISPSITTYSFSNPSYRIYTVDGGYAGATYTTKDVETYSTDVEEANKSGKEPVYTLEYNYRQFYNMTDLSPQSFSELSDRLYNDPELFKRFLRFYWRNPHDNECYSSKECRKKFVCPMKTGRSYDESFCTGLN